MINWIFKSSDSTPGQRWYIGSLAKDNVGERCIYKHSEGMFGCEEVTTRTVPEPVMQCFVDVANMWWAPETGPSSHSQYTSGSSATHQASTNPPSSTPSTNPPPIKKGSYGDLYPLIKPSLDKGTNGGTVQCTCGGSADWKRTETGVKIRCKSCGFTLIN